MPINIFKLIAFSLNFPINNSDLQDILELKSSDFDKNNIINNDILENMKMKVIKKTIVIMKMI